MKLHYALPSPYVRKVLVVALEAGLADRIERIDSHITPVKPADSLNQDNPLGKIPCLVTDAGAALYDSRVICEYLDSLGGATLFPPNGPARWTALRRQAEADGMLDAAVGTRYETILRPEAYRWPDWIENQKLKFRRTLDALEAEAGDLGDTVDIGTIAVGCALGYLDFRYADEAWRESRPKLAAWYGAFAARPSMASTAPA